MKKITLIVTCAFGLEAVVKKEILALGFEDLIVSDGKIEFPAYLKDIPLLNISLRVADRVLLKLAKFPASDFDLLFDQTQAVVWEEWIPQDAKITVIGKSFKSKLQSVRTNQSMVKKAIVERLKEKYHTDWLEETGLEYTIQIAIAKDVAQLTLDTTGAGLHKRGYRKDSGEVPLRENLAAALVLLSPWKKEQILMDPMCGAGTIAIEAAMIARHIAPGLKRAFISERWPIIGPEVWEEARETARAAIQPSGCLRIFGHDVDEKRIEGSRKNAAKAGVLKDIVFACQDIKDLQLQGEEGLIITNPPWGVKLSTIKETRPVYAALRRHIRENPGWSVCLLTADKKFPDQFGRGKPNRVRKLYNGTLQIQYYQYLARTS